MRLDKFLKTSRLIKQRSKAKLLCDAGAVLINGKAAKAGSIVNTGDRISAFSGNRRLEAIVLEVPVNNVSKAKSKELIEIISSEWIDEE